FNLLNCCRACSAFALYSQRISSRCSKSTSVSPSLRSSSIISASGFVMFAHVPHASYPKISLVGPLYRTMRDAELLYCADCVATQWHPLGQREASNLNGTESNNSYNKW